MNLRDRYNPGSCRLARSLNRVKFAIRAGEKLPEGDWVEHFEPPGW